MAKRGALTDLNHDNWDKEDETEEAGEFKKASDEQMKGRVIRKAKRKLTEDNKKNVFAGFGGFTSSNQSASDIFGFLAPKTKKDDTSNTDEKSNGDEKKETNGEDKKETNGNVKDKKCEDIESKSSPANDKTSNVTVAPKSSETEVTKPVVDPFMAKFMKTSAGTNWTCDICMVSNPADAEKCLACGAPNPKAKSSTIDKTSNVTVAPKSSEIELTKPVADPFMAKFMKTSAGSNWTCDICMVSNPADEEKCLACGAPNPKAKSSTTESKTVSSMTFGEGGGFKFNSSGDSATNSSTGFKFGSSTETTTKSSGFSIGSSPTEKSSGGFKFGISSEEKAKPVSGGFTFGSSKVDSAETSSSGFKFGGPSEEKTKPVSGGFTFGSSKVDSTETSPAVLKSDSPLGGFKFGGSSGGDEDSKSEKSKSVFGGFKFASKTMDDKKEKDNKVEVGENISADKEISIGGFKFGSSEVVKSNSIFGDINKDKKEDNDQESGFNFGNSDKTDSVFKSSPGNYKFGMKSSLDSAPETPRVKRGEYLASLKGLNIQVTNWIRSHVEENPLIDLTPVFKDYQSHITELKKKFNDEKMSKSSSVEDEKEVERAPVEVSKPISKEQPKPFSFGTNSSTFGQNINEMGSIKFGGLGNGFKFGSGQDKSADDKADEETEEEAVPVVATEPLEESDSLYTKKCKLFYKKGEAYSERGLGYIHLKRMEDGRLQVVIRADTSLGNILLNIVMSESIAVQRQGKNNVLMVCVPNPPLDPKDDPEPIPFLIRVKTEEDADELKEKLTDLMKPTSDE